MPALGIEIKRKCPICGKVFIIKTLDSIYCTTKYSKVAYKRKKDAEKKEALFVAYAQNMPDIREYLTAKQVIALYGIERSTLYRLARLGKIPCINLGVRLTRFKRSELDLLFHYRRDLKNAPVVKGKKLYSLEPEDCYTIGEIMRKSKYDEAFPSQSISEKEKQSSEIDKRIELSSEIINLNQQIDSIKKLSKELKVLGTLAINAIDANENSL